MIDTYTRRCGDGPHCHNTVQSAIAVDMPDGSVEHLVDLDEDQVDEAVQLQEVTLTNSDAKAQTAAIQEVLTHFEKDAHGNVTIPVYFPDCICPRCGSDQDENLTDDDILEPNDD